MKKIKTFAVLCVAALIAGIFSGCDSSIETIRLKGNATQGFVWDYESVGDDVVDEVARRYWDGNLMGSVDAPGVYIFSFKGRKAGEAKLVFRYVAEDAENGEYLSTIVYDLKVDENGKITECRPVGVMATELETD